jgi:hypothetical protein
LLQFFPCCDIKEKRSQKKGHKMNMKLDRTILFAAAFQSFYFSFGAFGAKRIDRASGLA